MGFARGRKGGAKGIAAAVALVLAALLLVACGDDDGDGTTTAASDSATETTPQPIAGQKAGGNGQNGRSPGWTESFFEAHPFGKLTFVRDKAFAEAGKIRLQLTNPSKVLHDLTIEDSSGKTLAQTERVTEESAFAPVVLKPGKYTFYCSVPGHREAGMEGTLFVN